MCSSDLGQILTVVLKAIGIAFVWLCKGLWWLICLPFRGIAALVRKIKKEECLFHLIFVIVFGKCLECIIDYSFVIVIKFSVSYNHFYFFVVKFVFQ